MDLFRNKGEIEDDAYQNIDAYEQKQYGNNGLTHHSNLASAAAIFFSISLS